MLSPLLTGIVSFFFLNDTATTEISPLPLPDALPIFFCILADANQPIGKPEQRRSVLQVESGEVRAPGPRLRDRKSTRLNSSHGYISYAVFCLKKKNTKYRSMQSSPLYRRHAIDSFIS